MSCEVEIVAELKAIHALLEWQKTNILEEQEKSEAKVEQFKTEVRQLNEEILERARQNALEVQQQVRQEHEMAFHQVKRIVQ